MLCTLSSCTSRLLIPTRTESSPDVSCTRSCVNTNAGVAKEQWYTALSLGCEASAPISSTRALRQAYLGVCSRMSSRGHLALVTQSGTQTAQTSGEWTINTCPINCHVVDEVAASCLPPTCTLVWAWDAYQVVKAETMMPGCSRILCTLFPPDPSLQHLPHPFWCPPSSCTTEPGLLAPGGLSSTSRRLLRTSSRGLRLAGAQAPSWPRASSRRVSASFTSSMGSTGPVGRGRNGR